MTLPIRPDDLELLSSYLDNALPEPVRADVEARLAAEPDLRAMLDSLHTTVHVLRAAPLYRPPRNFTLDPARYRRRVPWWASDRTMQTAGALGAFVSVVLIVVGVFSSTLLSSPSLQAPSSGAIAVLPTSGVATQGGRYETTPTLGQPASDKAAAPATVTNETVGQDAFNLSQPAPTATALPTLVTVSQPTLAAAPLFDATRVANSSTDETAAGFSAAQPPQQTLLAEGNKTTAAVVAGAAVAQAATATQQILKSAQGDSQNAQSPGPAQPGEVAPLVATNQPRPVGPQGSNPPATALPSATTSSTPSAAPTATQIPSTATPHSTSVVALQATATLVAEQGGAGGKVEPYTAASATLTSGLRDDKDDNFRRQATPLAAPAYFLIFGIALFIFSVMLFGVGWLRSRL